MREILFRGKCLDTEKWIEGYGCIVTPDDCVVIHKQANNLTQHTHVVPSTFGQYTGMNDNTKWSQLTDKEKRDFLSKPLKDGKMPTEKDWKGKRIFEGDIGIAGHMHHGKPINSFPAFVLYNSEVGSFRIGYKSVGGYAQDELYFRHEFTVIGNIHDNPELLNP